MLTNLSSLITERATQCLVISADYPSQALCLLSIHGCLYLHSACRQLKTSTENVASVGGRIHRFVCQFAHCCDPQLAQLQ